MLHRADLPLRQPVPVPQGGPAVGAVQELVAERQPQLGMRPQVRDRPDAEPVRGLLAHPDRVGVVEPQRPGHLDPAGRQRPADVVVRPQPVAGEDLARDGARVFGVNVDFTRREGAPDDARAAELLAELDVRALRPRELRRHLAERDRLGVELRPDADGVAVAAGEEEKSHEQAE